MTKTKFTNTNTNININTDAEAIIKKDLLEIILKKPKKNRLFYAIYYIYYKKHNKFFNTSKSSESKNINPKISASKIKYLARKLNTKENINIPSQNTIQNYKKEIRNYLKFTRIQNQEMLKKHAEILFEKTRIFQKSFLKEKLREYAITNQIEVSNKQIENIIANIKTEQEKNLINNINKGISDITKAHLDGILLPKDSTKDSNTSTFNFIKKYPINMHIRSIQEEIEKLEILQAITLPNILSKIPNNQLQLYYREIINKYPSAIKNMPEHRRYFYIAIFCYVRKRELNDNLAEILISITHKIFERGKQKVKKELSYTKKIKESINVHKTLQTLAKTIIKNEDKVIKESIYKTVSKEKLEKIANTTEKPSYNKAAYEKTKNSYNSYYRKTLLKVIDILDFDSTNPAYKNTLKALSIIKESSQDKYKSYKENSPVKGVIKKSHEKVISQNNNEINKADYELGVLDSLKDKIKLKEIFIKEANMFKDPDKELPQDFEKKKEEYFKEINQPLDVKKFINAVKVNLTKNLNKFNKTYTDNDSVEIIKKPEVHIKLTPLKEQEKPTFLENIKKEVYEKFPNTSLLDILKECDDLVGFTNKFIPSGSKEALPKDIIRKRILLSILGCGTNVGLKNISIENENNENNENNKNCRENKKNDRYDTDINYKNLQYTKKRYLDVYNLKLAIRDTVNYLLKTQMKEIWQNCSTAVASDSKHFKTSSQNLISKWHPRYHRKGVLIYWHVDRNSICIYSQLMTSLSSEVATMAEGILHHETNKEINKSYVDTHGQSEVGFAFSYILGFELLPRFKNIHLQKLYANKKQDIAKLKNIKDIIKKPIDWDLITKHYEQIIKYSIALKEGNTKSIMKRFSSKAKSPLYKAIIELGRAIKTIFLCKYLMHEPLRQEIHEGLNVVERFNGVNNFIFYGNNGVLSNKNPIESEISMLCLHLLQLSMTLVNTLMLQQIITESKWLLKMTLEDKRAITPLIHQHINPYGVFKLDLNKRLPIRHYNNYN